MVCASIGEANPDIAGIGGSILIAFVIQSLIAVFVSFYAFILSNLIKQRWKDADPDPCPSTPVSNDIYPEWLMSWLKKSQNLWDILMGLSSTLFSSALLRSGALLKAWEWVVGKQPNYPRERTEKSKIEDESTPTSKRLKFAYRILLAGNDAQTFTGIALLISALVQYETLGLYHMHILYDAISLVVISNCAASMCIFSDGPLKGYTRLSLIGIWSVLFISYFGIFALRLQTWDEETALHCYRTKYISHSSSPHPRSDHAYIGVTFLYIMFTIFSAVFLALEQRSRSGSSLLQKYAQFVNSLNMRMDTNTHFTSQGLLVNPQDLAVRFPLAMTQLGYLTQPDQVASDAQNFIIGVAMLQCPLHIYSIFALRAANEQYLDSGGVERDWGFGQIVAMVLLGANFLSIADGVTGYIEESELEEKANADARHRSNVEHAAAPQSNRPGQVPKAAEPDDIEMQVQN